MRKICVITGSRAEYGLLSRLMHFIKEDAALELQIIATNMHLSPEFGLTYKEIEAAGFTINKKIEMLLSADTPTATVKSVGLATIGFADAYQDLQPEIIVILGDRYEMLAAASAALFFKIPVAHLHGGEITEGAYDDAIRHAITKMSHLHFTATEEYRNRVIQMGEQPNTVFNAGAIGVDNIMHLKLLSKEEFEHSINFLLDKTTFLVTYHPETLENNTAKEQFSNLLDALDHFPNSKVIFTKPNSDTDGRVIIQMIDEYVAQNKDRAIAFTSLGQLRYLSALQYTNVVIGNSSSGILEVPSFKKPTVNIGDRQKGRISAASVINCKTDKKEIIQAISMAFSKEFQGNLQTVKNPYHKADTAQNIVQHLKAACLQNLVQKRFYNIA